MRISAVAIAALCTLAALTGCGGRQRSAVYNGFLDVVGNGNEYRILGGSDVIRLQVVGDHNDIVVEDDAVLTELYILGKNNRIELPPGIHPYGWWRGASDNRIINRPAPPQPDVSAATSEYRLRVLIESAPPRDTEPLTPRAGAAERSDAGASRPQ